MTNLRLILVILVLTAQIIWAGSSKNDAKVKKAVSKEDVDKKDKVSSEELDEIRRKVNSMNDDQLSSVLQAVMPQNRYKRTIGTVRRCIEKVRCLFGGLQRQKRQTSPSAATILRAISKLTGLASSAANELGNRFGLGGDSDFSLASIFRDTLKPSASSSSSVAADDDVDSEVDLETEDTNVAEGSEVVEEKICDQRCQLSVLVYRRLRRLLRRF